MTEPAAYMPSAGRFTDWLRAASQPHWDRACNHRFTQELAADSIEDAVYRRYLVQDYAFIETLVTVLGHAVAYAPGMAAKKRFAGFLTAVTSEENDYFIRSFDALAVPQDARLAPALLPATRAFAELMLEAARSGRYEQVLAVIVPAEWIYLSWASAVANASPSRFYLKEWIDLHANDNFSAFVNWLRGELDDVGAALSPARRIAVAERFTRLVELEAAFFEAAYA